MKTIEDQMKVADSVLYKLETLFPAAILAGGAPRDWEMGVVAKDLDFYLYLPNTQVADDLMQLNRVFVGVEFKSIGGTGDNTYEDNIPYIKRVYEGVVSGEIVQLILLESPKDCWRVLDDFACDLCRVWYKSGTIHYTKDFKRAMKNGVITYNSKYNKSNRHYKKMKERFPDWDFVIGE